ncbi:MAG: DUF3108 domain-containing protein [Bacteroidetes bacterium]|nr:DUF3108 domain-containing protein [Bacteroidota bacterium]
MKGLGLLAVATIGIVLSANAATDQDQAGEADKSFVKIKQSAFRPGEKLTYRLSYGAFDAGEAVLTVEESEKTVQGRKLWKVRGVGKTISAFEWFYKVNDRYESYMDAEAMFPWLFVRRVDEGGYIINQDYTFHQHKNLVDNGEGKKFNIPDLCQDMISAFYYARTLDFSNAKKGDIFTVNIFLDDELYPTKIKYLGKEEIKIRKGKFRCHKFAPIVQEGRVFNSEEDLTVWITDDGNKIPILAKANIKVGSLKMHLTGWEGLVNPMAKIYE